MTKKTKKSPTVVELPTNNMDMEKFVVENRFSLYTSIVDNIEQAMDKKQLVVRVFQFSKSPFVILINHRDFRENLEHIFSECIKKEHYELCDRIKGLLGRIGKPQYIKQYKKYNFL